MARVCTIIADQDNGTLAGGADPRSTSMRLAGRTDMRILQLDGSSPCRKVPSSRIFCVCLFRAGWKPALNCSEGVLRAAEWRRAFLDKQPFVPSNTETIELGKFFFKNTLGVAMKHPRDNQDVLWIADLSISTLLLYRDQRFKGYSI